MSNSSSIYGRAAVQRVSLQQTESAGTDNWSLRRAAKSMLAYHQATNTLGRVKSSIETNQTLDVWITTMGGQLADLHRLKNTEQSEETAQEIEARVRRFVAKLPAIENPPAGATEQQLSDALDANEARAETVRTKMDSVRTAIYKKLDNPIKNSQRAINVNADTRAAMTEYSLLSGLENAVLDAHQEDRPKLIKTTIHFLNALPAKVDRAVRGLEGSMVPAIRADAAETYMKAFMYDHFPFSE